MFSQIDRQSFGYDVLSHFLLLLDRPDPSQDLQLKIKCKEILMKQIAGPNDQLHTAYICHKLFYRAQYTSLFLNNITYHLGIQI